MQPRDYNLLAEGYNEKVKIQDDKELIKLRFARLQAFFTYCSVPWKDAPKTFSQFCKELMPLPGDETGESGPKIMTKEMLEKVHKAHNKKLRKLK